MRNNYLSPPSLISFREIGDENHTRINTSSRTNNTFIIKTKACYWGIVCLQIVDTFMVGSMLMWRKLETLNLGKVSRNGTWGVENENVCFWL